MPPSALAWLLEFAIGGTRPSRAGLQTLLPRPGVLSGRLIHISVRTRHRRLTYGNTCGTYVGKAAGGRRFPTHVQRRDGTAARARHRTDTLGGTVQRGALSYEALPGDRHRHGAVEHPHPQRARPPLARLAACCWDAAGRVDPDTSVGANRHLN